VIYVRRAEQLDEVTHPAAYRCPPLAAATTRAAVRVDGGIVDTIA